jgi:hypothetical protein
VLQNQPPSGIQAAMASMSISHKILTLYPGIRQGYRVVDVGAGVTIRITCIQRIPARGSIELHWLLDAEEVKDGSVP